MISPESCSPVTVVAAAIREGALYLVGLRPKGSHNAGHWEFPGGKVEAGETREQALVRELREELGVGVHVKEHLGTVEHDYETVRVTLHLYECTVYEGRPRALYHAETKWLSAADLRLHDLAALDRKLLAFLSA